MTDAERIAQLEARLAAAEARIALLEARQSPSPPPPGQWPPYITPFPTLPSITYNT